MGVSTLLQSPEPGKSLTRLGIIAALPIEAQVFINSISPLSRYSLGKGVCLQLAGQGHERARAAARKLVDEGVNALLSWGLAGALDPGLDAGTLILPDRVIGADGTGYTVDPSWHRRLQDCFCPVLPCIVGILADSPEILKNVAEKHTLQKKRKAIAVDMESAAIAAVARQANIPFAAVRIILDAADVAIPISARKAIDIDGSLQFFGLIRSLLRRPYEVAGLVRLALATRRFKRTQKRIIHLAAPHFTCDSGT